MEESKGLSCADIECSRGESSDTNILGELLKIFVHWVQMVNILVSPWEMIKALWKPCAVAEILRDPCSDFKVLAIF